MKEADLSRAIQAALSNGPTRLFRRHVGTFWAGTVVRRDGDFITLANHYAVKVGEEYQADLYGIHLGRHVEIEVKRAGGHTKADRLKGQTNWLELTTRLGGLAGFASSIEEAQAILAGH